MEHKNNLKRPEPRYFGNLLWPIVVIVIGVVLLLRNMGYISGDVWDILLRLWPVLLIGLGLDGIIQRHGLAGPTVLISLGAILILHNFSLLAWDFTDLLLRLWPVLLVALGLDILIGRKSIWGGVLAVILTLVLLSGVVWYFGSSLLVGQVTSRVVSQPMGESDRATLAFHPAMGSLRVGMLVDSTDLVNGDIYRWKGETILEEYSEENTKSNYVLNSSGMSILFPGTLRQRWGWDIKVTPDLPLEIITSMGVGEIYLDLQSLQIDELDISMGLGKVIVILPAQGDCLARIEGALGELVIYVPDGMELRIRSETGMANVNLPPGYVAAEGDYFSPAYPEADDRTDLWINQAIGRVIVKIY